MGCIHSLSLVLSLSLSVLFTVEPFVARPYVKRRRPPFPYSDTRVEAFATNGGIQ